MSESYVPTVTELIANRIKEKSQPGKITDGFKLGYVFEGGAMRGVVGAGALQISAILSAQVAPTAPAPTTVIFIIKIF